MRDAIRLVDRRPNVPPDELIHDLVPAPRFQDARFSTYRPNPDEPTQAAAVAGLEAFATRIGGDRGGRRWFRRGPAPPEGRSGVYLDGGFGVGKTHLLASLWHAAQVPAERKLFCTFVELTNLAGALGFGEAVSALSDSQLLCVDEFELDDPGDTVLVASLLRRLTDAGVLLAATATRCRTSWGRDGLPRGISSARSRRCPRTSTSCELTVRTIGAAVCPPRRDR